MYLSKSKIPPPPNKKKSANKKYFTINFICLIQKRAIFYVPLPISVTVSIFTVSAFISLTLIPNIPTLFTAIPQQTIISPIHCTGYTALLSTLHSHFWWDALLCHSDSQWLDTTFLFLGLQTWYYIFIPWFTNLTEPMKKHNFLQRWCLWCQEFKYMFSGFLCHVCGLISWGHGSLYGFQFSKAIFLLLPLD